jgi:hypothetical protein
VQRLDFAAAGAERSAMGSPADYTIIVLVVAVGVGLWTLLDRVTQLQRDLDAIKRTLGAEAPADEAPREH